MEPSTPQEPSNEPTTNDEQAVPISQPEPSEAAVHEPVVNIDPLHPDVIESANSATTPVPPVLPTMPEAPVEAAPPAIFVGGDLPAETSTAAAAPDVSPQAKPRRRVSFKLKSVAIAVLGVLVVAGGSAAAYAGVIVPNKPANVLKSALLNSLQSKGGTFTGTVQGGPATGTGLAYKATISGASNTSAKAADISTNVTVSGVTFPFEAKLVGGSAYFKLGDLSNLTSLVNAYAPSDASLVKQLSGQISNKWFAVDSTLLNEAGGSCYMNINWTVSKADQTVLENDYAKEPFTTIVSSGSDTVNGQKTEKLVLSIDDDKATTYLNSVQGNLSIVKQLEKCDKSASSKASNSLADHDKTPLTVWVDKSTKQIVQVSSASTAADAKKDNEKVSATIDFKTGTPTITAPTGAEPVTTLVANLETSLAGSAIDPTALLSGLVGGSSSTGGSSNAADATRQTDIQSLQTQLEAYYTTAGNYPSLTDMNSASWRAANMPGLDPTALQDPSGSSKTLVSHPTAKAYAYNVTTTSGASCEANDTQCGKYTLTATLSDGSVATLQSLE
jgi:hypothetical protein